MHIIQDICGYTCYTGFMDVQVHIIQDICIIVYYILNRIYVQYIHIRQNIWILHITPYINIFVYTVHIRQDIRIYITYYTVYTVCIKHINCTLYNAHDAGYTDMQI